MGNEQLIEDESRLGDVSTTLRLNDQVTPYSIGTHLHHLLPPEIDQLSNTLYGECN